MNEAVLAPRLCAGPNEGAEGCQYAFAHDRAARA
jgi:hypothetical protein